MQDFIEEREMGIKNVGGKPLWGLFFFINERMTCHGRHADSAGPWCSALHRVGW